MINFISIVVATLGLGYLYLGMRCRSGLVSLHDAPSSIHTELPPVTVIVAAHNEEQNIGHCMDSFQSIHYPQEKVQFIIVDDGSTDATVQIIDDHPLRSRVTLLSTNPSSRGKQAAIHLALGQAVSEIILTTDADCVVSEGWVNEMVSGLDEQVAIVAGPVLYTYDRQLHKRLQAVEFLGLVAVGAGSIGAGIPTICNSANLLYRKSVFVRVSEQYEQLSRLPGFDEALIQTVPRNSDWQIAFRPGEQAAVTTLPVDDPLSFIKQRIRWASMAGRLPDWRVRLISIWIFLFYAGLSAQLVMVVMGLLSPWTFLFSAGLKLGADLGVLIPALKFYGRQDLRGVIALAEVLHVPYILLVSMLGALPQRGSHQGTGKADGK